MKPAVSILTPMKNAAPWIAQTIESVRAQTFQDWEMIVMDDGSRDESIDIARKAAQDDARIHIHSHPGPHGAAGARNGALARARGRYIAFLDSDDMWDPTKLERQIGAMRAQGWVFSWTSYRVEMKGMENVSHTDLPIRQALTKATRADLLSKRAPIGCLTVIYDRAVYGDAPMVETLPTQEDFVLWAQLMGEAEAHGWKTGGIDEVLATYRLRGHSLSGNKAKVALRHWRVLVDHCGQSPLSATRLFASYALRGVSDRIRLRFGQKKAG